MKAASTSLLVLLALLGCGSQEPMEAGGTPTVRAQRRPGRDRGGHPDLR